MRFNRPATGFFIGLVMPLIGFLIVYLILFKGAGLGSVLNGLARNPKDAAKVLSLSILANVLPFVLLTNRRLDYGARGVFIATMLYAVVIVLLRFVW